jgi:glycerol-3-phosphate O-acyltransferase / dihydroxyacetone phosphate acyltransferase
MSNAYVLHRIIRRLAGWAVWSFFTEVHVIGEENVPKEGPIIV